MDRFFVWLMGILTVISVGLIIGAIILVNLSPK